MCEQKNRWKYSELYWNANENLEETNGMLKKFKNFKLFFKMVKSDQNNLNALEKKHKSNDATYDEKKKYSEIWTCDDRKQIQ